MGSPLLSLLQAQAPPPAPDPDAPHAVHVIPHQDDEVLTGGAQILADVAAGFTVYCILTNRGEASAARTSPALTGPLGFTPTQGQFSAARDREFVESCWRLGATPIVPPYAAREPDGAADHERIVELVKTYAPPGGVLRGTAPTDLHPDHQQVGHAVVALAQEEWGTDPRLMISPLRIPSRVPPGVTMTKVGAHGDVTAEHVWPYLTQSIGAGWWGVGGISVGFDFDYLLNVDGASYWHSPVEES